MRKTEVLFPILVTTLSIYHLVSNLIDPFLLSNLVSLIGLIGVFLFAVKNRFSDLCITIWIVAQIVIIPHYLNLAQVFDNIKFGLNLTLKNDVETGVFVNVIPLFYFGMNRILNASRVVGEKVIITQYRNSIKWGDIFPLHGTIIGRHTLNKEKDWLILELKNPTIIKNKQVSFVLIKPKDTNSFITTKKLQLSYMRAVLNIVTSTDISNEKKEHPFFDWVNIKILS